MTPALNESRGRDTEMRNLFLTLGLFLITQLIAAIWWASGINATVGVLGRQIDKLVVVSESQMTDRYTATAAARDWNAQQLLNEANRQSGEQMRARITRLEDAIGKH